MCKVMGKLKIRDTDPHGVWLRHNCRCSVCLSPFTNQNIVHHSSLIDLTIKDATLKGIKYSLNQNVSLF